MKRDLTHYRSLPYTRRCQLMVEGHDRYWHTWIVELPELYSLRQIRMRLWDGDDRFYRYVIETSADGTGFKQLINRSEGEWRSWQVLVFPSQAVRYIRIRGILNPSKPNPYFQVFEFEAYCNPNPNPPPK